MKHLSIGRVCDLLGISLSTAYRWIKAGKLIEEFRTVRNHLRFNLAEIEKKCLDKQKSTNDKVAVYAKFYGRRSHKNKVALVN